MSYAEFRGGFVHPVYARRHRGGNIIVNWGKKLFHQGAKLLKKPAVRRVVKSGVNVALAKAANPSASISALMKKELGKEMKKHGALGKLANVGLKLALKTGKKKKRKSTKRNGPPAKKRKTGAATKKRQRGGGTQRTRKISRQPVAKQR